MTSKKLPALVSGTELTKFLKTLGAVSSEVAKSKAEAHFKGRSIIDGIWNISATSAGIAKPSYKKEAPQVNEQVLVENNMQNMLATILLEEPMLSKTELEERIGSPITKDTFNRAQIVLGGVTKFQKELFEDFIKTAVYLETNNKPYRQHLSVSEIQRYTRRKDGLRYGPQIRNSAYFHKAVADRLRGISVPPPVVTKPQAVVTKGYEKISSIILERGYDALLTVDSSGNKVIEIVRIYK